MKYVATFVDRNLVHLECKPWFGKPYTISLHWDDGTWWRSSGRQATDAMLDAIDQLMGVRLTDWKVKP